MRHDEMRLRRWKQIDFVNAAIKVSKSRTDHGAGRAVPMNKGAHDSLTSWAAVPGSEARALRVPKGCTSGRNARGVNLRIRPTYSPYVNLQETRHERRD
jgi:hypothetical protein